MAVTITRGTNDAPVASGVLAEVLAGLPGVSGKLFLGYPVVATLDGPLAIDALWASREAGFVLFDLVEGADWAGHDRRQENLGNVVEAKLRFRSELVARSDRGRVLLVPVHTVTFAPGGSRLPRDGDFPLANRETLAQVLAQLRWTTDGGDREFHVALSDLENVSTIRRTGRGRRPERPDSRGAKLRRLEGSVATLDTHQNNAIVETTNGVQRIRGLAGSGKSIVLALKAAYLHARHPDWRICVTFQTRSLKPFFHQLIEDAFVSQTKATPDWQSLRVVNAWGAPGDKERDGVYHQFCTAHGLRYHDLRTAKTTFGATNAFGGACRLALKEARSTHDLYDVVLVDEAQDLPPAFLRICYELLTKDKRLVYAYDELQNLGRTSMPGLEEIFGQDVRRPTGSASHDIVLKKCYRNSRPVLVTAHALGFGVHRKPDDSTRTGIVQIFDDTQMWHDTGYRAKGGEIRDGQQVVLVRTTETSPRFLEEHSPSEDLVQFVSFDTDDEQAEWVAEQVARNIRSDELRPDDIVVINPDPFSTPAAVGPIRALLHDNEIEHHLPGIDTEADIFRQPDSVTFTGIHRAKGNEFGMVYVINAHECYSAEYGLARIRNRLFTAITRSKAWVRVCGVGDDMKRLMEEFDKLRAADYELRFVYPTAQQHKGMRVVHRDRSSADIKLVEGYKNNLSQLMEDLKSGKVYREDLPEIGKEMRELLMVMEGKRSDGQR